MIISKHAEDLKSCPFCGGQADIEEIDGVLGVRKSAGCLTESCQGYQSNATFSTIREAAAAWNTRAIDSATAEEAAEKFGIELVNLVAAFRRQTGGYPSANHFAQVIRKAIDSLAHECEAKDKRIAELERALTDERASNTGYLKQWKELAKLLDTAQHDRCVLDLGRTSQPRHHDCPRCAWEKLKQVRS